MTRHAGLYRAVTFLYPRSFRREFGPDLVQAFNDLARERGVASAWARSSLDLAVTVPRYHLEALMRRPVSSAALTALTVVLGLAAVAALTLGVLVAMPLVVIAGAILVSQRTALARSLDAPANQRRVRLGIAAVLALVTALVAASWIYHINRYESLGATTLFLHNIVGMLSLFGAAGFGLAGLLTKRVSSVM